MARFVTVGRFVLGVLGLSAVASLLWLTMWATVVPVVRGWSPVAILTGSMGPTIDAGDVVITAPPEDGTLGQGAVIVFDNPASNGWVTHRVVAVDEAGDYITRGDANPDNDSTPVPPDTIHGVGRLLVPAIGLPFVWAAHGRWASLSVGLLVLFAAAWTSRWATLARFNPWSHASPPAELRPAGRTRTNALRGVPCLPRLTVRTVRRLVAVSTVVGLVVSIAAGITIQADAAFAATTANTGNGVGTDTLDPPTAPTATGTGPVTLDWTATTDTYATGNRVYRATVSGGPYAQVAQVTPRTTVTYDDTPPDGTYYYVLRAYSASWESANSAEVSATVATVEDNDAIVAASDNCPSTFNVDQYDTDGDGTGDACDASPTLATSGTFTDGGQSLDSGNSRDTAIGDLDGDGDLDLAYANSGVNTVWTNNGAGVFTDSGQTLGSSNTRGVAAGDLDGDGDLDLAYANGGVNTVWFNDGAGVFTDSGQTLDSNDSPAVAVGDLDGDGDLDLAYANNLGPNTVWLNDGAGVFTDSGQTLDSNDSRGVAVGDLDGDGDLDLAYANNGAAASTVWLNDGAGVFTDSGQTLDLNDSQDVVAGDLDGDGDLDLAYANENGDPNTVWLNDGAGVFTDSGQALGSGDSQGVAVGDLDGDGDLDLAYANESVGPNTVWFNDGAGVFTDSGQTLGSSETKDVNLGDLDGDGDLDLTEANSGSPNTVWFNS